MVDVNANAIRNQVMGKSPAEVQAVLGAPQAMSNWDTAKPPDGATPAQIAQFEQDTLEKIWVYRGAVLSFNMAGQVHRVADNWQKYVQPRPNPPMV